MIQMCKNSKWRCSDLWYQSSGPVAVSRALKGPVTSSHGTSDVIYRSCGQTEGYSPWCVMLSIALVDKQKGILRGVWCYLSLLWTNRRVFSVVCDVIYRSCGQTEGYSPWCVMLSIALVDKQKGILRGVWCYLSLLWTNRRVFSVVCDVIYRSCGQTEGYSPWCVMLSIALVDKQKGILRGVWCYLLLLWTNRRVFSVVCDVIYRSCGQTEGYSPWCVMLSIALVDKQKGILRGVWCYLLLLWTNRRVFSVVCDVIYRSCGQTEGYSPWCVMLSIALVDKQKGILRGVWCYLSLLWTNRRVFSVVCDVIYRSCGQTEGYSPWCVMLSIALVDKQKGILRGVWCYLLLLWTNRRVFSVVCDVIYRSCGQTEGYSPWCVMLSIALVDKQKGIPVVCDVIYCSCGQTEGYSPWCVMLSIALVDKQKGILRGVWCYLLLLWTNRRVFSVVCDVIYCSCGQTEGYSPWCVMLSIALVDKQKGILRGVWCVYNEWLEGSQCLPQ